MPRTRSGVSPYSFFNRPNSRSTAARPRFIVSGFERDGIPFLKAGDEFSLTLRECVGKATETGLAGLRRLVIKEVSP
jgi:hypothetical protein